MKHSKKGGNEVFWHWKAENRAKELELAKNSQIYITSTNALTLDGKLVSMDGVGNRVSSMFYGHEKVYIIVGRNKICKDYDEARERIKKIAAPKNAQRLSTIRLVDIQENVMIVIHLIGYVE